MWAACSLFKEECTIAKSRMGALLCDLEVPRPNPKCTGPGCEYRVGEGRESHIQLGSNLLFG